MENDTFSPPQLIVDKNELLQQGKYFGRIFLDYLWCHPVFSGSRGKDKLAEEILVLGQAEKQAERSSLAVKELIGMRFGRDAMPYWVNYSVFKLALEHGFKISHPADAVAVTATVIKDFQLNKPAKGKEIALDSFLIYVASACRIEIPAEYLAFVKAYLESRRFTVK